jgi:hypothetical protein
MTRKSDDGFGLPPANWEFRWDLPLDFAAAGPRDTWLAVVLDRCRVSLLSARAAFQGGNLSIMFARIFP